VKTKIAQGKHKDTYVGERTPTEGSTHQRHNKPLPPSLPISCPSPLPHLLVTRAGVKGTGSGGDPSHAICTSLFSHHIHRMEQALQRSDQNKLDKLRRIRGAMDRKESPLSESEKDFVLKCAGVMKINGEEKLQACLQQTGSMGPRRGCPGHRRTWRRHPGDLLTKSREIC
jgi:hypothetical protein